MQSLAVLLVTLGCLTDSAWGTGVLSVRIQQLDVPSHVNPGSQVTLSCYYELDGSDLYSVKWYHYGIEFYRYMPSSPNPVKTFSGVPGIKVNVAASDQYRVVLSDITLDSEGEYTCEVAGEAPLFITSKATANMHVFDRSLRAVAMLSSAQRASSVGGLGLVLPPLMALVYGRW